MSPEYLKLKENNRLLQDIHKPELLRLVDNNDRTRFNELVSRGDIFLHDEIYSQLKELFKSRNPTLTLNDNDYAKLINEHLTGGSINEYGVWVYYPWSKRVVHILDEDEFVELRTSANKNKITIAERNLLATKKVGVIGLSVGQSVSVTLALERGCGELRLADFDTLELNNLNRIRTGVHNLGLLKAYSVAREIAEIDPYFKVVCYIDGINDENINDFFLKDGKLDLVIDECDGVNIKILCRIKAKELNVPVLMEASDRGTMDVERFDLEPDRPIIHGWLQHLDLDLEVLKNLKTNQEKLPYILPISGLDTLSVKMQASMIEMRNTITTWPQLATAVTLGGALTADTARRIFLDQFTDSGRYFIDLESLVPDTREKKYYAEALPHATTQSRMISLASKALATLTPASYLPQVKDIDGIVSAAIKAPSASNSQPWKWHFSKGYLFLFYEDTGVISFGDYERRASYIAHGAAIENLKLEAYSKGLSADVNLFPLADERDLVAVIGFKQGANNDDMYKPDELGKYIGVRATNRDKETKGEIAESVLMQLKEAVTSVAGAELIIKTDATAINALADIIGPCDRLKILNPASHYEFYNREIRWDDTASDDGISIASLSLSQPEEILLKMAKRPEVIKLLAEWKGGQALEFTSRICVGQAAAMGLIVMPYASASNYIMAGKAMQRMWLTATQNNIAIHPMMAPLFYFSRINNGTGLPEFIREELQYLHDKFEHVFSSLDSKQEIFLFKLSVVGKPAIKSRRKALGAILSFDK